MSTDSKVKHVTQYSQILNRRLHISPIAVKQVQYYSAYFLSPACVSLIWLPSLQIESCCRKEKQIKEPALCCSMWIHTYMGGNLLTVQSMEMMSYFFFLFGHCFWQFRGLESQEMKYFLKIY